MYLAGVSVRRVEDIPEALWGSKVSATTISELNKKAYVNIEAWRNRPLQGGKSGSHGAGEPGGLIAVRSQSVKGKTSGVPPPLTLCALPAVM